MKYDIKKTGVVPLTVGDSGVIPLTVGDSGVIPLTVGDTNVIPMVPDQGFNCPHCGAPGQVVRGQAHYTCYCRMGHYGTVSTPAPEIKCTCLPPTFGPNWAQVPAADWQCPKHGGLMQNG